MLTSRRSCSIACFKKHITAHDQDSKDDVKDTESKSDHAAAKQKAVDDEAQPAEPLPKAPYARLRRDARFQTLLSTYPDLKRSLNRIYLSTVHPHTLIEEQEARVAAGQELDPDNVDDIMTHERRWGGSDMKRWTQENADKRAVGLLVEMQMRDEGVAEFAELIKVIVEEIEAEVAREKEGGFTATVVVPQSVDA